MIAVSLIAAAMMTWFHFTGISAPGCGPGSACDTAARSLWPLIGLAYFASLLAGWLSARVSVDSAFKWIVRLGVLISLVLIGVMVNTRLWCPYCVAVHVGNLGFWLVVEFIRAPVMSGRRPLAAAAWTLIGTSAALAVGEALTQSSAAKRREAELAETTRKIVERTNTTQPSASTQSNSQSKGFTGRYRLGPENAPIRLVIISDYQCSDCNDIEKQVHTIMATRKDVSVSAKHYPMSTDCNVYMGRANMHENACWAARAAETAGILRGNDGFWKMHHWLFEHEGYFITQEDLNAGLTELGYTADEAVQFTQTMRSQETMDLVKADIEEAHALGLFFTPMVFINGVELRGFVKNPTALIRAVEAAANPPPGSPLQDRPPAAIQKCIDDWKAFPVWQMPTEPLTWPQGSDNAPIKIVIWSDLQFPWNSELDQVIRAEMAEHGDIQYTFRTFPSDNACNPNTQVKRPSQACWTAAAGEAAGMLGGAEGYWKMHDWLIANQAQLHQESVKKAATQLGMDPEKLAAAMMSPQVQAVVTQLNEATLLEAAPQLDLDGEKLVAAINSPEIKAAVVRQGEASKPFIRQGIPTIYVNNKWVARWRFDEQAVLDDIIDEARKQ